MAGHGGQLAGSETTGKAEKMDDPMHLLELDVDVLIPAALENQITAKNPPQIKASIITECANGPANTLAPKRIYRGRRMRS